jgi:hypothetical protein
MVIHNGFQTDEFYWAHERSGRTALSFGSREEAFWWLTTIDARHSDFVFRMRRFLQDLARQVTYGLSDQELLWQAASLLHRHHLMVDRRVEAIPQGPAPPAPPAQQAFVPFPLSRGSRPAPAPAPPSPELEDPTFSDGAAFRAQAAVLIAAAQSGAPFCPE